MKSKTIAIIGDGLGARLMLYRLSSHIEELLHTLGEDMQLNIIQLADSLLMPDTSTYSTAHTGHSGVRPDVSPLGDLLIQGLNEVNSFFNEKIDRDKNWGIRPALSWHLGPSQKIAHRFSHLDNLITKFDQERSLCGPLNHFIFDPDVLLNRLSHESHSILKGKPRTKYSKVDARVFQLSPLKSGDSNQTKISYAVGESIYELCADFVYSSTGGHDYFGVIEKGNAGEGRINFGNIRPGVVWRIKMNEQNRMALFKCLKECSWTASHAEKMLSDGFVLNSSGPSSVLTYRADKFLMIGGTSQQQSVRSSDEKGLIFGHVYAPDWIQLSEMYQVFWDILFKSSEEFDFSRGEIVSGNRHYLSKRFPFCGEIGGENIFTRSTYACSNFLVRGLYKNGYNLSFLASRYAMECLKLQMKS